MPARAGRALVLIQDEREHSPVEQGSHGLRLESLERPSGCCIENQMEKGQDWPLQVLGGGRQRLGGGQEAGRGAQRADYYKIKDQ